MAQGKADTASWLPAAPDGCLPLSAPVLAILTGEVHDRSTHALVASVMLAAVQAGYSDQQAARLVEQSPGLGWRTTRESDRGWSWLLNAAERARNYAQDHPAQHRQPELVQQLAAARQAAAGWSPEPELAQRLREQGQLPQQAKLRAVGEALLELAEALGRVEHLSVSVRQLGELAGVHKNTAAKALRVWRGAGLAVQVEPSRWVTAEGGREHRPATYRLDLSALTSTLTSGPADELLVSPAAAGTVAHDAWRHGGLGHGAWQVWRVLRDDQLSEVDELAAALDASPRTVQRYLQRLEPHRLVTRVGDGWRRCTVAQAEQLLVDAARHEGTQGRGERQREVHRAEREAREAERERWRQHLRQQHLERERGHYLPEPPDEVELGLPELVTALREQAAEQARERAPVLRWGDPDEVPLRELVQQLAAVGDELRRQLEPTQRVLQSWADGAARQLQTVARWADEHADELAAARAEQGVHGG